jgi:hypothetical protein
LEARVDDLATGQEKVGHGWFLGVFLWVLCDCPVQDTSPGSQVRHPLLPKGVG